MAYLKQYGWDYPPNDPVAAREEMTEYIYDGIVLALTPEQAALNLINEREGSNFYNAARRIAEKYEMMHGKNTADRFKGVMNSGSAVYGYNLIGW